MKANIYLRTFRVVHVYLRLHLGNRIEYKVAVMGLRGITMEVTRTTLKVIRTTLKVIGTTLTVVGTIFRKQHKQHKQHKVQEEIIS